MAKNRYLDFDLNFDAHPVTGDISILSDASAVIQSLKNLVLTKPYENAFEPNKGSRVSGYLFEVISPMIANSLRDEIRLLATNWEPRAEIIDISIYANDGKNGYDVVLIFNVVNIPDAITVDFFLERLK